MIGMAGVVLLVGAVCGLAGIFVGVMSRHWLHGDEWDRLAAADRRRCQSPRSLPR